MSRSIRTRLFRGLPELRSTVPMANLSNLLTSTTLTTGRQTTAKPEGGFSVQYRTLRKASGHLSMTRHCCCLSCRISHLPIAPITGDSGTHHIRTEVSRHSQSLKGNGWLMDLRLPHSQVMKASSAPETGLHRLDTPKPECLTKSLFRPVDMLNMSMD